MTVRRRFLALPDRRVHYLRAGTGPPALLIHSSPANTRLLQPEIEALAGRWTVFAFDTPGFGLSDPLPQTEMNVADLADALAETLAAIGMPPCPIFGTHTGAAIALEFGVRHPDRVTGLVLDGVPMFTAAECAALFGDYFRTLPVTDLGGHYTEAWTRFRDQSIWFPWSARRPENLNRYDLSPPERTHLWVSMYFDAAPHYAPAYRAALAYGPRASAAATELDRPAVFTASDTDMLRPHLERLPPMKQGQEVRSHGTGPGDKTALIAAFFARFGSPGQAPADQDAIGSSRPVERQFVDMPAGTPLHIRYAGDCSRPTLLLLHDAPGSAALVEELIQALAAHFFVVAPDLPGQGESGRLNASTPSIADFAALLVWLVDRYALTRPLIYGIGFGASAALALAEHRPTLCGRLALRGVLLPEKSDRAALRRCYAPPIEIAADGSHWYRTWLMLRDSLVYWPWYDRRLAAQRRGAQDFDAARLHRWTLEIMRAREGYADLIHAALDHDAAAALAEMKVPLLRLADPAAPFAVFEDALADLRPESALLKVTTDPRAHAADLVRMI